MCVFHNYTLKHKPINIKQITSVTTDKKKLHLCLTDIYSYVCLSLLNKPVDKITKPNQKICIQHLQKRENMSPNMFLGV